jgi:ParB family chromosome partitioning protein
MNTAFKTRTAAATEASEMPKGNPSPSGKQTTRNPAAKSNVDQNAAVTPAGHDTAAAEDDLTIRHPVGTILNVNPRNLVVGDNVRKTVVLGKEFVNNIRERGVRHAIHAYYNPAGQLLVDDGQRRTLAAVEAGRPIVRVEVIAEPGTADRIIDQLNVNRHREGVNAADEAAAYEQLSLLGMTAAEIARKNSVPKTDVDGALKAAKSLNAKAAAASAPAITMDQLAVLSEFDDDPNALKTLLANATNGQFKFKAQELRDEKTRELYRQKLLDQLAKEGTTVIEEPGHAAANAADLGILKDRNGKRIDPAKHVKCPGHSAYLRFTGGRNNAYTIVYSCRDLKGNSHYRFHDSKLRKQDMTPEQINQAAAARREVIANNKAWLTAETVRREFLSGLFARKAAPKGTTGFLAVSIMAADTQITNDLSKGHDLAAQLMGVAKPGVHARHNVAFTALLDNASEARTQMIMLAIYLSAYEEGLHKGIWRYPQPSAKRYLTFLAANGYSLSPVERLAAGLPEKDDPTQAPEAETGTSADHPGYASPAVNAQAPAATTNGTGASQPKPVTR